MHYLLHNDLPDIVLITETWLNDTVTDNLITDSQSYNVFRTDRQDANGGGVCILTNSNSLTATPVTLPARFQQLELCCIDVLLPDSSTVRLVIFYRPPGASNRNANVVNYMSLFYDCINTLIPSNCSFILCGDLNLPTIDWSSSILSQHCSNITCTGLLLDMCFKHGLQQLITFPTRESTILDLLFTNDPDCIVNIECHDPFSTSDHATLHFNIV